MLVDGFFNHKRNKKKTKDTKLSRWVFRIRNALARIATKAPKVKKLSFAEEKERPKEAPFYSSKTRFLSKGLQWKAGSGFKKKAANRCSLV
jgi:hypothetical protein